MYRRYYSYNDMPQLAQPQKESAPPARQKPPSKPEKPRDEKGLLHNLETDDIILIVVALLLLMNDCDDKLLILAIGFIFLSGLFE